MKEIQLIPEGVSLVDDEDFEYLNQFKWYNHYNIAYRTIRENNMSKLIGMHREIMKTPKGLEVDHWDHNTLNNQKSNLRNCTHKENCQNSFRFYLNNHAPDEVKKEWAEIERIKEEKYQSQITHSRNSKTLNDIIR
jgi:UDP-N-acetylglucosamine pyrophosphorylase